MRMPRAIVIDSAGVTTYRGSLADLLRANRGDLGFRRLVVDGLRERPRHVLIGGGAAPACYLSLTQAP